MSIPADLPKPVFTTTPRAFVPQFFQDTRIEAIPGNVSGETNFVTVKRQISGFPVGVDKFVAVDINACLQLASSPPPPPLTASTAYGINWQITNLSLAFLLQSKPLVTFPIFVEGNDQATAGGGLQEIFGGWSINTPPLATGYGSIPVATGGIFWRSFGLSQTEVSGGTASSFPPSPDNEILFNYASAYNPSNPTLLTGVTYPSSRLARRFTFDADTIVFTATVAIVGGGVVAIPFPVGFGLAGMIL
jgi:hypothetical protein